MAATIDADLRLLLEWVFENALDEDKSGFLEDREANRVAKYCGYGGPSGDITALWTKMLREMDTDGDGRISKEEYVVFMSKSLDGSVAAARNLKDEVDAKLNQKAALDNNYAAEAKAAAPDKKPDEPPLGLLWRTIGSTAPSSGRELTNAKLSFALKRRTEFAAEDLAAFELPELKPSDYIKAGTSYFQPFNAKTDAEARAERIANLPLDLVIEDYRDPDTGAIFDRKQLNEELEKIEKPAGIANPKDFRNEIVNFVLRARANNEGRNPHWTSYEKLREVIEKKMFSSTEELLPVMEERK